MSDENLYDGYDDLPALDEVVDLDEEERPAPVGGDHAPPAIYGSLQEFVADYLLPLYRRGVSGQGTTWCAEWWRHPEAWVRLDALWRSWEYLRLDPATGMSAWLRDHADPHMAMLLSADGPFRGCKPDEHSGRSLRPLPTTPIPADALDPTRFDSGGED